MTVAELGAAAVVAAFGGTGTGKSAWIKSGLRSVKPSRLLIWDPMEEYAEHGDVFSSQAELIEAVRHASEFQAIYRPGDQLSTFGAKFDRLCRLAWALGNLTFVVDELADVTTPTRAPDAWGAITRRGRHRGIRCIAASQRPASVDKSLFSNLTFVHVGRLTYGADQEVMAAVLSLGPVQVGERQVSGPQQIAGLLDLEFFERNMLTGEGRRSRLAFHGRKSARTDVRT